MLKSRIQKSWLEIYDAPDNLNCYENYYRALVACVNKHKCFFTEEMLTHNWLDVLLLLNPDQCNIHDPDIRLADEKERVQRLLRKHFTKHDFIRFVGNTLRDIVLPHSGRDCPAQICSDGGGGSLRYIWYEGIYSGNKYMVLECNICAYAERLDGFAMPEEKMKAYPIGKDDIAIV
jgi:hypothetical protein